MQFGPQEVADKRFFKLLPIAGTRDPSLLEHFLCFLRLRSSLNAGVEH